MKHRVLNINIPAPCAQVFEEMPVSGEGRFCGKCHNTVYDFSRMTDMELFRFFENSPAGACGRFHNDQLNRDISPVIIKRNIFQRTAKIAASIIAVLTLRNTTVHAQGIPLQPVAQNPVVGDKLLSKTTNPLVIKGTVKNDDDYKPLPNVLINFDGIKQTRTDQNGFYTLELTGIDRPHNIYFSCPNYVPTVRTFNPAMGSTDFNVVMGERDSDAVVYSMGIAPPPPWEEVKITDFPSLTFKGSLYLLTDDDKALLSTVGTKMKEHPMANIRLVAYRGMHEGLKLCERRTEAIKSYLVDKEGISEGRIMVDIKGPEDGSRNIIDIVSEY